MILGQSVGPFEACLDADLVRRYASATADPCSAALAGEVVPPVAIVTQIWHAQNTSRNILVPAELQRAATGGVHGEHEVRLHRPLVPGEPLQIWVDGHGARPAGRNVAVTLRYVARDVAREVVAEQWWTTMFLGVSCEAVGSPPPDHAFPEAARTRPIGTYSVDVEPVMATRYAEVSGDWSAHHFEIESARVSGFDRLFIHGLCTMALCGQAVVQLAAGGDPERVRRVAVRFASPAFLGERLDVTLFDAGPSAGPGEVAFEAESASAKVVTHGRALVIQ